MKLPKIRTGHARHTHVRISLAADYSRLHSIVYQEIIAGRGHRIEDAAGAVRLAERVNRMAEIELPAAR
jgi:hypothetical protein